MTQMQAILLACKHSNLQESIDARQTVREKKRGMGREQNTQKSDLVEERMKNWRWRDYKGKMELWKEKWVNEIKEG